MLKRIYGRTMFVRERVGLLGLRANYGIVEPFYFKRTASGTQGRFRPRTKVVQVRVVHSLMGELCLHANYFWAVEVEILTASELLTTKNKDYEAN